jgi:hypothetical protein
MAMQPFLDERPLATPRPPIANAIKADHACRLAVSDINTHFSDAGGSPKEFLGGTNHPDGA